MVEKMSWTRPQTLGEEIANSISHGVGFLAAVAVTPVLIVMAASPLYNNLPGWGLFWLLVGGVMYSTGVLFFAYDHRVRYNHFIWHLFVLAGTGCHVVAVLGYTLN